MDLIISHDRDRSLITTQSFADAEVKATGEVAAADSTEKVTSIKTKEFLDAADGVVGVFGARWRVALLTFLRV